MQLSIILNAILIGGYIHPMELRIEARVYIAKVCSSVYCFRVTGGRTYVTLRTAAKVYEYHTGRAGDIPDLTIENPKLKSQMEGKCQSAGVSFTSGVF